jgi:hypothetical protein
MTINALRGPSANTGISSGQSFPLPAVERRGPMLHIDIPTVKEFKALAQVKGDTCVSLHLPTSPLVDNIRANRTAFKDLAKEPCRS